MWDEMWKKNMGCSRRHRNNTGVWRLKKHSQTNKHITQPSSAPWIAILKKKNGYEIDHTVYGYKTIK